jgi:hypothetical protein
MGCLVLALGASLTTCRLDKLINPAIADRLAVSPESLRDSANAGSIDPRIVTLRIESADGATLPWRATKDSAWLTLSPSAGGAPTSLVVTLHADALSEDLYQDTIVFTSTHTNNTVRVPVTFDIRPPAPELSLSDTSRADTAFAGSALPDTFTLLIHNTGALPLMWGAAVDVGWLTLSRDSGGAPPSEATVVTLTPAGLGAGTHTGTVTVTAPLAIGSPKTVSVTFTINPCEEPGLVPDTVVTGSIALSDCGAPQRPGRQAKLYAVQANAADTLSFRLNAAFNAYLVLTNSTGTVVLDSNDVCVEVGTACITNFPVPAPGRYVIEVTTANSGETGAFTLSAVKERTPIQPAAGQFRANGATPIGVGAVTPEGTVVFKATLNDPNPSDSVRLEVEVEGLATGPQTYASAFVLRGTPVALQVDGLNENEGYHWRARTCDKTARCSTWFSFGGNAETAADFFVNAVLEDPVLPAQANQFQPDTVTEIPVGGSASTIVFKGLVTDPDPGDLISLDVEYKTTDVSFNGAGTRGTGVATGKNARLTVSPSRGLVGLNYYWRARACDQTNRCSGWFSFGNNDDVSGGALNPADTDFRVP